MKDAFSSMRAQLRYLVGLWVLAIASSAHAETTEADTLMAAAASGQLYIYVPQLYERDHPTACYRVEPDKSTRSFLSFPSQSGNEYRLRVDRRNNEVFLQHVGYRRMPPDAQSQGYPRVRLNEKMVISETLRTSIGNPYMWIFETAEDECGLLAVYRDGRTNCVFSVPQGTISGALIFSSEAAQLVSNAC